MSFQLLVPLFERKLDRKLQEEFSEGRLNRADRPRTLSRGFRFLEVSWSSRNLQLLPDAKLWIEKTGETQQKLIKVDTNLYLI